MTERTGEREKLLALAEEEARDRRKRRWRVLAEDGGLFGLTPGESTELARLEKEFGDSGLAQELRAIATQGDSQ